MPSPSALIELAIALAEHAHDLPTAIYHVRSVPFGLRQTIAARALEGRWRHLLDDIVGASQAFSEARETASQLPTATIAEESHWLLEAALFELDVRGDARTAKRHAELALLSAPSDSRIQQIFRRAAKAELNFPDSPQALSHIASSTTASSVTDPLIPSHTGNHHQGAPPLDTATHTPDRASPVASPDSIGNAGRTPVGTIKQLDCDKAVEAQIEAQIDAQIEALTSLVRANPSDQVAIVGLCQLLEQTSRHMDLIALVSAGIEETTDSAFRSTLLSTRNRVLRQLIRTCRDEGRSEEAAMYEMVLGESDVH